jgi:hypothetical protein
MIGLGMSEREQVRFHAAATLKFLEAGRNKFDDLLTKREKDLVETVWALREHDLRAIVLERVVAEQGARRRS